MQCPVCSGETPILENSIERPHAIQTDFWYAVSDSGLIPEDSPQWDFNGILGVPLAIRYVEKRLEGATLTAHYCVTEGDKVFTIKSRIPLTARDRAALFSFMKDSLRLEEKRGRKRSLTLDDIRRAWKR